ncbi:hypothetical protein, partial [Thermosynechococcus sp. M55_K2018_012]|uniref:hypothetical protein n=1 Tax=Thermosynechococcus sp. M55_K2018_012 TaxID=2747809 RepID=UPI0025D5E6FB
MVSDLLLSWVWWSSVNSLFHLASEGEPKGLPIQLTIARQVEKGLLTTLTSPLLERERIPKGCYAT